MAEMGLGSLLGYWLADRYEANKENKAAKALGKSWGYDYDAEKNNQGAPIEQTTVNNDLWRQAYEQNKPFASAEPNTNLGAQLANRSAIGGQMQQINDLWRDDRTQNTSTQAQPVNAQLNQPIARQNVSLWNMPANYDDYLKQQGANGNTATTIPTHQTVVKGGYPDKDLIFNDARKQAGKDLVALVKGGFSLNDARAIAEKRQNELASTIYNKQAQEYQDTVLEPMRQQIFNNLVFSTDKNGNAVVNQYDSTQVKGLIPAVMRYNAMAQRAGQPTIDLNNLNSIAQLNKRDYKFTNAANGHILRTDSEGNLQDMGSYGKVSMQTLKDGHTLQVGQDGQIIRDLGIHIDPQHKYMKTGNGLFDVTTGQIVPGTQALATGNRGDGTSGLQAQRLRALTQSHAAWMKANIGADESESPYYAPLQNAMGIDDNSTVAPSSKQPSYSQEEQQAVATRINELHAQGYSKEEIDNMLDEDGLSKYKSYNY